MTFDGRSNEVMDTKTMPDSENMGELKIEGGLLFYKIKKNYYLIYGRNLKGRSMILVKAYDQILSN